MNFALFTRSIILPPLQHLVRWLATPQAPKVHSHRPQQGRPQPAHTHVYAPQFVATHAMPIRAGAQKYNIQKPLRIARVVELGQSRTSVGRMVISGRMNDVCAELARLVEREAAMP